MTSGKTRSVGVIVPPTGFFTEVVRGIHDTLQENDHVMLMGWSDNDLDSPNVEKEREFIERFLEHRVDGLILRPPDDNLPASFLEEARAQEIPFILVDRQIRDVACDFVGSDNAGAAKLVARELMSRGHRHVAQLAGSLSISTFRERCVGFERAVSGEGRVCQTLICPSLKEIPEKIRKIFSAETSRPSAILCANDEYAVQVLKCVVALGLKVPEDLSIVGFGNMEVSAWTSPPLASVDQKPYEIGRQAAELFFSRLDGAAGVEPQVRRLPVSFVSRPSLAAI